MRQRSRPIRRTLITALLLTSGAAMLTSAVALSVYDFMTYRQSTLRNLGTLGTAIAANSTAALAFDNPDDAREVLSAFRAESHVVAAGLYVRSGRLFASYPAANAALPTELAAPDGYRVERGQLIGVQPVVQGGHRMGTLYLKSDMGAIYERFRSFSLIAALVLALAWLVAYVLSIRLQKQISRPILALAATASEISKHDDYTVRAPRAEGDELLLLTDAFNRMLTRIGETQGRLQSQLGRLDLLQRITRAIGERQDLASIFQVVLRNLEQDLPIDFGCVCSYEANAAALSVAKIGASSRQYVGDLALEEGDSLPIEPNGLARSVRGELVYEPDISASTFPFPQRFVRVGLHSLVLAPMLVENSVFGVLVVARRAVEAFSSGECEFLRHLSEHVALAVHQTQLYEALQRAYDDLHQSQQAVLQQERLRALGQMASGIAHDINNAISPIALYTESLLEREAGLSARARSQLSTIQRAIEDVAETVARMREFYRPRESELQLSRVALNRLIGQVIELTRARWSDVPLQQGIVIRLETELAPDLPEIMGSEGEIRDALTNLVFNAVDAMPEGGTLTLQTLCAPSRSHAHNETEVYVEVSDTGVGMSEETRRRCLEPFYTTKGERGTGLGLAMVYGMIQRHSAELDIESAVGTGTTVRVVFGVANTPADVEQPSKRLQPLQRLRILLVDDDPMLVKSLRDILEGDGHVITVADGGQNGIDTFQAARQRGSPFSLVITDLGMPYVDGRKVAAAVKTAAPSTPVIMLTGWGRRLLSDNDVPPYVDRLLSKPPKLIELRAALAELVGKAAHGDAQQAP
jgi:signal transduction histidine kinase/ActR/RegA family two-component response regulator